MLRYKTQVSSNAIDDMTCSSSSYIHPISELIASFLLKMHSDVEVEDEDQYEKVRPDEDEELNTASKVFSQRVVEEAFPFGNDTPSVPAFNVMTLFQTALTLKPGQRLLNPDTHELVRLTLASIDPRLAENMLHFFEQYVNRCTAELQRTRLKRRRREKSESFVPASEDQFIQTGV